MTVDDPDTRFLTGGGHTGDLIARFDWARTAIGPLSDWSESMRAAIGMMLRSPVAIVTLWGDSGVMIYNDAYRRFSGDRHPALLGSDVLDGWPEVADFNAHVMQAVLREGRTLSYRDQPMTLVRDGVAGDVWLDLEYSPVCDAAGWRVGVMAIVIERTDRVLADRMLADDRDRLWSMSRDLMLVATDAGIITAVNPTATRTLGWAETEMVGRAIADFLHPDDHAATLAEMQKLASGLETLAFENRYRTRDGGFRTFAWTAVPDAGRVHAVGRDVTEERRLARDRERIWTLSPVLKVVTDREGIITDVNPSWTTTLGWTHAETVGRRSADFIVDDEGYWRARVDTLAAGTALPEYDTTLRTRDGQRRLIKWTTVPENDTFYGFGRDVTVEAEAAAALAEAEAALRQAQKMEAVGQLTGGIAHDFNNLLQGISGCLEIAQRRVAQGRVEDLERLLTAATGSTQRAASLTHRLLAFSRRQPLDPRAVDANALVGSVEDLLRRTIGERIRLDLDLAPSLWPTKCDPNQLESAILNLAINARDAMPDGGVLSIATEGVTLDPAQAAREGVRPGAYVRITVGDTGLGMDPATLARAFEPFFTTKPMGQGTGLGLSMIYGFARQSEGHASIDSGPGQGTRVSLYLPRFTGPAVVAVPGGTGATALRARAGETVLVIEDEAVVRDLVVSELTELGYAVRVAETGAAGLAVLREGGRIDLLVTDIGLPGLNGRQVADLARAMRPDLSILFMTGYAEEAAIPSGFLDTGMAMITKPFTVAAFTARIAEIIGE